MPEDINLNSQQDHLKNAIGQQRQLVEKINQLNNELSVYKEQALKLQGIIEYLRGLGVSVEEEQQVITPEVENT